MAEGVECIGGQVGRKEDRLGALLAALLVDHLQTHYADIFNNELRWQNRVPFDLGDIVCNGLNRGLPNGTKTPYRCAGLEAVAHALQNEPLVKQYLGIGNTARTIVGERTRKLAAEPFR